MSDLIKQLEDSIAAVAARKAARAAAQEKCIKFPQERKNKA